jgi:hypothetical protein
VLGRLRPVARIAAQLNLPDRMHYSRTRTRCMARSAPGVERSWHHRCFVRRRGPDASLLLLPEMHFMSADDPHRATMAQVEKN